MGQGSPFPATARGGSRLGVPVCGGAVCAFQFFPSCCPFTYAVSVAPLWLNAAFLFQFFPSCCRAPRESDNHRPPSRFQFFPSCCAALWVLWREGGLFSFNSFPVAAWVDVGLTVGFLASAFNSFPVAARAPQPPAASEPETFNSFPVAANLQLQGLRLHPHLFQFFPSCC